MPRRLAEPPHSPTESSISGAARGGRGAATAHVRFYTSWSPCHGSGRSAWAAAGFDAWERLLAEALERMRQRGELRANAAPAVLATGLLASIEGGMVLSQARKDITSLRAAVEAGLGQVRAHLS